MNKNTIQEPRIDVFFRPTTNEFKEVLNKEFYLEKINLLTNKFIQFFDLLKDLLTFKIFYDNYNIQKQRINENYYNYNYVLLSYVSSMIQSLSFLILYSTTIEIPTLYKEVKNHKKEFLEHLENLEKTGRLSKENVEWFKKKFKEINKLYKTYKDIKNKIINKEQEFMNDIRYIMVKVGFLTIQININEPLIEVLEKIINRLLEYIKLTAEIMKNKWYFKIDNKKYSVYYFIIKEYENPNNTELKRIKSMVNKCNKYENPVSIKKIMFSYYVLFVSKRAIEYTKQVKKVKEIYKIKI